MDSVPAMTSGLLWRLRMLLRRMSWSRARARDKARTLDAKEFELESELPLRNPIRQERKLPTWRAIIKLAGPFFYEPDTRVRAIVLSVIVMLVLAAESFVLLSYSEVNKNFMTALQDKKEEGFYHGLWQTAKLIMIIIPIIGVHTYAQRALETEWRAKVTRRLANSYLAGDDCCPAFYAMTLDPSVDNPDQRICNDTASLVSSTISLVVDSCGSAFRVLGFIGVLYRISPVACLGIVTYVLLCTATSVFGFGPPLFKAQQTCTVQDASLRYCLIRVRENAESIAFFRGGHSEWLRFDQQFGDYVKSIYRLTAVSTGFSMFTSTVKFATFAVPALMVGPSYMRGEVEFGAISQAGFAFSTIFEGLMLLLNRLHEFSSLAVQITRLRELEEAILSEGDAGERISLAECDPNRDLVLAVEEMTLRTPHRPGCQPQTLVRDLTLSLCAGQSMLIAGNSGIGKSSLLRGIAGLWTDGQGSVCRCSGSNAFFMPQRPYMFTGTLRDQLLYPNIERTNIAAETLREVLATVNLRYIAERHGLDECQEWSSTLSLGEQQRLNFARMFLQPSLRIALIDEGTSACDPANEAYLYELLTQRKYSFVSVGHRPALRQYHTHALWLRHSSLGGADTSAGSRETTISSFLPMKDFEAVGPKY